MKKRAISIVLTIIMLLTMLPAGALAEGDLEAEPVLKMHLVGGNGGELDSLNGPVYGCWNAQFYLHYSDNTTKLLKPDLPDFLTIESMSEDGSYCLKATGIGTGSISCTEDGVTYSMPVTICLPDLGLYTSLSFDASSLVEDVTISTGSNVFYIALRPDLAESGYQMTAVSTEFGSEVNVTNLTKIGAVSLSTDGSYATVTVTDMAAEGPYHFEATVRAANSESDMKLGRSVWINNDMPGLYYCDLMQEESRWTVNYEARSDWWCSPGSGRPVCFYFGSKSQVESGNGTLLSKDDLSFPAYMEVNETIDDARTVPENALDVNTIRFGEGQESTDIIYRLNGTEYKIPAQPQLPVVGFYTQPAASKDAYIYDRNPFVVTEMNRTFYICTDDPARISLTGIEMWYDEALAGLFDVTSRTDENGGICLEITVKDSMTVPDGWFGAQISYQRKWDENNWNDEISGASVFLKNGQPALMYRRLDWDNNNQNWYESEDNPLETYLALSANNSFPVQFYYGTSEANTKVALSELTFPTGILQVYTQQGVDWVKGIGFEETGTISYRKDGITAAMHVNVSQPDVGFYSSPTASKATFLGEDVAVNNVSDTFYIVAGQNRTILSIEAIQNNQTGEDATSNFAVTLGDDGKYACIQMIQDSAGNLPAGVDYTVLIDQDWGTCYLHFNLIRNDLPQLSTPTDLVWHRQYRWGSTSETEYEDRMGVMSFKVGDLVQNRFAVEIYSAADNYTSPVASGGWQFGDMDHAAYFTVTDFIYAELPSGTYKFRVRAEGDGTVYRDSDWSDMSPEFVYTAPVAQLSAPDAALFDWVKNDGHYLSTWQHTGEAGTGYYEINWYYKDGNNYLSAHAGCFDMWVWDADEGTIYDAMLPDELLEEYGNVNLYFCVRAIPSDITAYRISEWSDFGGPLDVDNVTTSVNQKLDALLSPPSGQTTTVADVQTALENETADLHTAMAADLELSGGASSGTLEKIQALEAVVSNTVDQKIEAKNSAPTEIQDIAKDITMIGATLNLADKNPETGTKPTVTLELDEPKKGIVIDEQQHNAVQFSMKLNGAIDKDDQAQSGQQLIVPVVIDMPVPAGINPDFLVVLHQLWDGSIEQIRPYIYLHEDGRAHARFVIDSFSDFALVEYNFRFSAASVTKVLGDAPFTMAAVGNANGSNITYSSSDTSIAKVDPKTGSVTMMKSGTVTITAVASRTDVYPEAQASYTLSVTATNNPSEPTNPNIPSTAGGSNGTTATEKPQTSVPVFTDVKQSSYYYDAVQWAVENGVTDGTSAETFSPERACTRAQAVTFLWRAAGCPTPKRSGNSFTDVKSGAYYADAVQWAMENGITDGTGEHTFSPDSTCTRAQIVTFLFRALGEKTGAAMPFTDVAADAYYAPAVAWAATNGVTGGTTPTAFSPDADCTRAQIVTFLYRCLGK